MGEGEGEEEEEDGADVAEAEDGGEGEGEDEGEGDGEGEEAGEAEDADAEEGLDGDELLDLAARAAAALWHFARLGTRTLCIIVPSWRSVIAYSQWVVQRVPREYCHSWGMNRGRPYRRSPIA